MKVLGLTDPFTKDTLLSAYRTKAKFFHPDLNPGIDPEKIKAVNAANDYLIEHVKPTDKPKAKTEDKRGKGWDVTIAGQKYEVYENVRYTYRGHDVTGKQIVDSINRENAQKEARAKAEAEFHRRNQEAYQKELIRQRAAAQVAKEEKQRKAAERAKLPWYKRIF